MSPRRMTILMACLIQTACGARRGGDRAMDRCRSGNADSSVAGCTAIVEAGGQSDSVTAVALQNRGNAYRNRGDFDRSLQDYDRAIALRPSSASAYNSRGITWQLKGNHDSAMASFRRALDINPLHALARKNLGRAEFYLGRFAEAAEDLEKGRRLDSANTYVVIWLHIAKGRAGQADSAEFVTHLLATDSVAWPAPVASYYLGRLSEAQLLVAAAAVPVVPPGDQRCAAQFYIGEGALLRHRSDEAILRLQDARAGCPPDWTEYQAAVAELGRLRPATKSQ